MTWEQFMLENCGYQCRTTFWSDFSIADKFGIYAIQDTFNRAFDEWKSNCEYLTELVIVLNHKLWEHYKGDKVKSRLYSKLWEYTATYASCHLTGKELDYYLKTTD